MGTGKVLKGQPHDDLNIDDAERQSHKQRFGKVSHRSNIFFGGFTKLKARVIFFIYIT